MGDFYFRCALFLEGSPSFVLRGTRSFQYDNQKGNGKSGPPNGEVRKGRARTGESFVRLNARCPPCDDKLSQGLGTEGSQALCLEVEAA
jgi:hypothetical protein